MAENWATWEARVSSRPRVSPCGRCPTANKPHTACAYTGSGWKRARRDPAAVLSRSRRRIGWRRPGLGCPLHGHFGLASGLLEEITQRDIDICPPVKYRAFAELDISECLLVVAGTSVANPTSMAIPACGSIPKLDVRAPRQPISSCTVDTP